MIICKAKLVEILLALDRQQMTFNELKKELGISPATLTRRISEMEKYHIILPVISKEKRKKIEYVLTEKGKRLIPTIKEIINLSRQIDMEFFKSEEK
ncbi:MAG: winged helix-turn-helix transcriptional regulator [Candidatus Aenigmatarchaeota archaeon]